MINRNAKKTNLIIIFLLVALMSIVASLVLLCEKNKKVVIAEANLSLEIQSIYSLDETIALPEKTEVVVDGVKYTTIEGTLIAPDGMFYEANGAELSLNKVGRYFVRYYYIMDGKTLYVEKSFNVSVNNASVSSNSSSVQFSDLQYKFTEDGEVLQGLNVKVTDTDTFTYNKPIKLNENGLTNFVTVSHIALESTSRAYLYFRLTDCYDENNYIEFRVRLLENNENAPVHAAFSGGEFIGLTNNANTVTSGKYELIQIDDEVYAKQYDHMYPGKNYFRLFYDASTMRAYCTQWSPNAAPILINDFSNFDLYGQDSFKGFTNNEVYFSFYAKEFSGATCEMEFFGIGEDEGSELEISEYNETLAPEIIVDYQPTSGDMIYSTRNAKISLYDAIVYDVNYVSLSKEVYYNYGTPNQVAIPVENNLFTTRWLGEYTIVYRAKDAYGNIGIKEVPVVCVATRGDKMISIEAKGIADIEAAVGQEVQLPITENLSVTTINRDVSYKVEAKYLPDNVSVALNEDMIFVPMYSGEWNIVYTATDNVTTVEKVYNLFVEGKDTIIADGSPILPKYFIKNAEYSIENYYAYLFKNDNREKVLLKAKARFDGTGEYVDIEDAGISITGATSVSFQYVYDDNVVKTTSEYPIIDVGFKNEWNIGEYFQGDFTKTVGAKNASFESNKTSGMNTLEFIKELSFSFFNLQFSIPEGKRNFSELNITLTDYYDEHNSLVIRIKPNGAKLDFYVGTQVKQVTTVELADAILYYDAEKKSMIFGDVSIPIENPFKTDKCYFSISLCDLMGESTIAISKLNNQQTTTLRNDFSLPQIMAQADPGNKRLGEAVTVFSASATDILSPILQEKLTVVVKGPDENYVRSVDGVILGENTLANRNYDIKLDSIGRYTIQYICFDQNDRKAVYFAYYTVLDLEEPEINFAEKDFKSGDFVNTKIGVKHAFKLVECKDDMDETLPVVKIFVVDPFNVINMMEEENYTPTTKGLHKVIIRATDTAGNSSYIYYYLNVE